MWTRSWTRIRRRVAERGLLDTSVLIAFERIDPATLPVASAISSITLAELTAGPLATSDPPERARRQERLRWVEATFDPLPFDAQAARAYGRVFADVSAGGRKARGRRAVDLLIAATALGNLLPLYTLNPDDFESIGGLEVEVAAGRP